MLKKAALAIIGLVVGLGIAAPQKANAQVAVGVYVAPRPVYVAPPPYAYGYYAPGRVYIGGYWYPRAYAYRHFGYRVYGRPYYGRPYYGHYHRY